MGLDPQQLPVLERLTRALVKHQEAERALLAAAHRAAEARGSAAALHALARCDVLERRARLHVAIARADVGRRRAAFLDDKRRVPAVFRRKSPPHLIREVEVRGESVGHPNGTPDAGAARVARTRAAS